MKRIGRTIQLRNPDGDDLQIRGARIADLARLIENHELAKQACARSAVIDALRAAFIGAVEEGRPEKDCASAAIDAAGKLPASCLPPRPPAPADGVAVTTVSNMLARSARRRIPGARPASVDNQTRDAATLRAIASLEEAGGASAEVARGNAAAVIASIEAPAIETLRIEPPAMSPAAFASYWARSSPA